MGRFIRFKGAPVTMTLLFIIVLVFSIESVMGVREENFPSECTQVIYELGGITSTTLQDNEYWRALAAMFLHVNLLHLAANTFSLWQLGTLYEQMFGSRRFAFTYFASGIIASFASAMFMAPESVGAGASGAVLGVLGAFISTLIRAGKWRRELFLLTQLLFWAAVNLAVLGQIPNVDQFAHFAGLEAGLFLGLLPHREPPLPPGSEVIDVPAQ